MLKTWGLKLGMPVVTSSCRYSPRTGLAGMPNEPAEMSAPQHIH